MPTPEPLTTTLSTKGQVILPKPIRRALHWVAGTRLVVESTADGVLLKPEPSFPRPGPRTCSAAWPTTASRGPFKR